MAHTAIAVACACLRVCDVFSMGYGNILPIQLNSHLELGEQPRIRRSLVKSQSKRGVIVLVYLRYRSILLSY